MRRALVRWTVGAAAGLLPVWAASLLLSNSVEPVVWDEALGFAVVPAGSVHRHRSEGWARSTMGRHGIWGVEDVAAFDGPKVAVWGNSQVEGLMLADEDKIAQQLTRRWGERHDSPLLAYAVAVGGTDVAFAWQRMPAYEHIAAPTVAHVVVVPDLGYLAPRVSGPAPALRPTPALEAAQEARPNAARQRLLGALHAARLGFGYRLAETVRRTELRFSLGTAAVRSPASARPPPPVAAWAYLLDALRERTGAPIAFLYAPAVPVLEGGRAVDRDPDGEDWATFARLCAAHGIVCRSLADDFVAFHRETGAFPRGIPNHHPYRGHFNRRGAGLVAEAAVAVLTDALHPG